MSSIYTMSLPSKEAKKAVKILHKLVNRIKPRPSYPILEVVIKLNTVELRMIGMTQIIKVQHRNLFSFTIPFHDFYVAAAGTENKMFQAFVSEGQILMDNRSFSNDNIKIFHPENLQRFDLPMNSGIIDILSLKNRYSEQELEDKNYTEILEKQELQLEGDIHTAFIHLSKYGITYQMIKNMVDEKIAEYISYNSKTVEK